MRSGTQQSILAALIRGRAFGLEIADRVKTMTEGRVELSQGQLYPALYELEAEGFLKSETEPGPASRAGRPRKYYSLTAKGQQAALKERETVGMLWQLVPAGVTGGGRG